MKKLIAVLLALVIASPAAMAEVDLASMTFEELVQLRDAVLAEIITRPEVDSITLPAGEWNIGVDIPAGAYRMELTTKSVLVQVWGAAYKDYTTNGGLIISENREIGYGKIVLREGNVLFINKPVKLSLFRGL